MLSPLRQAFNGSVYAERRLGLEPRWGKVVQGTVPRTLAQFREP